MRPPIRHAMQPWVLLLLLVTLSACAPGAITPGNEGYCPPPFMIDAGGYCTADPPQND
ncbi:hypothetical protein [Falsiroseomonas sp. HW251]|uniref:hypothetical protein n=1 Tax=Falsiroseomonas sp. HW251 TaxID=3390998 RepID=UPI003D310BC4